MAPAFENDPGVQWMLAWQAGDETAFDRIVVAYSGQVYALLTRFLGPRASREDLVQEVFLRVLRSRERYQPVARFSTFLYRIVFNLSVNETQRGGAKELATPFGDLEELPGDGMSTLPDARAASPSGDLEQADVVLAVRRAIASLPDNQRMALILAKYEELPYDEIAEILGTSEKAVKSLVHRAREALRGLLAPWLQEEVA